MKQIGRLWFDYVAPETYLRLFEEILKGEEKFPEGFTVLDLACGFPPPKEKTLKRETPLASSAQEILEKMGARIIGLDISLTALEEQKKMGREAVLGDAFSLPFKNDSLDACLIYNLTNATFKSPIGGTEIPISKEEIKVILEEVFRVLKPGGFVIVNQFGYAWFESKFGHSTTTLLVDKIVPLEVIKKLAEEIGFKNIKSLPFSKERLKKGEELILESFPLPPSVIEDLGFRLIRKEAGAFYMEK